jgi:hypothetical protein
VSIALPNILRDICFVLFTMLKFLKKLKLYVYYD